MNLHNIKLSVSKQIISVILSFVIFTLLFSANAHQVKADEIIEEVENNDNSMPVDDSIIEEFHQIELDNEDDQYLAEFFRGIEVTIPEDFQMIDGNRLETFTIHMPQFGDQERTIFVYLPNDYTSTANSYPVIYLQNAQDIFHRASPLGEDWLINQPLFDFFSRGFDGEAIIIGITYDPINYWDEYSPWFNDDMYRWVDPEDANRIEGGYGDAYLDFIVNTLKPVIDNQFRTLQDRENTAISGYNMGGLISLYAGLTRPDKFSRVMAMSPAIWFAEGGGSWLSNNQLLELITTIGVPENVTFFIDVADQERVTELVVRPAVYDNQRNKISYPQAYLEGVESFVAMLIDSGLPINYIIGGIQNPQEWTESLLYVSRLRSELEFSYLLPLFLTPKVPPQITSAAATTFVTESTREITYDNTFTIEATGGPLPAITLGSVPPEWLVFIDNGDGTATISGTPPIGSAGFYSITIIADNGATPSATQIFKLRVADPINLTCTNESESCFVSFTISMSPYLNRTRKIWVYLPPGYSPASEGYQVIYLISALHFFGSQTGAYIESNRDWKFDETLDALYAQTGKGTIAVGIEMDSRYPWDEYTPWNNYNMDNWLNVQYPNDAVLGRGAPYRNFIVNTLKPIIDSSYNTKPDREHTAIGGGSRHALFAMYAGLTSPETFGNVMSMSPAVWLAEGGARLPLGQPIWLTTNQLMKWFDNNQAPTNVNYYLYIGTNETSGPGAPYPYVYNTSGIKLTMPQVYLFGASRLNEKLTNDGVITIKYKENPGGVHLPGIWKNFVTEALIYFGFYD